MHSYEDRIRTVGLYYRYGKKASVVVMELGYPSSRQLGRWVRIYEEKGDLPRGIKPLVRRMGLNISTLPANTRSGQHTGARRFNLPLRQGACSEEM